MTKKNRNKNDRKANSFSIRSATRKEDSQGFLDLIVELANYERLEPPTPEARRRLINDVFSKKIVKLFVAVARGETKSKEKKEKHIGYALYFYTYSSFLARPTLYLEDIFVLEEYRGKGVGRSLFQRCIHEARRQSCGRMEWAVLTWNKKAIKFYEKMGARRLKEWYYYRLTSEALERLSMKNWL